MAKARRSSGSGGGGGRGDVVEAPARNDVYTGMLLLSVVAMTVGVAALAFEANEYGWESEPKTRPATALPALPAPRLDAPPPVAPAPGAGLAPVAGRADVAAASPGPVSPVVAPPAPAAVADPQPAGFTPIAVPLPPTTPGG